MSECVVKDGGARLQGTWLETHRMELQVQVTQDSIQYIKLENYV